LHCEAEWERLNSSLGFSPIDLRLGELLQIFAGECPQALPGSLTALLVLVGFVDVDIFVVS
jgi:hypothetical protein